MGNKDGLRVGDSVGVGEGMELGGDDGDVVGS